MSHGPNNRNGGPDQDARQCVPAGLRDSRIVETLHPDVPAAVEAVTAAAAPLAKNAVSAEKKIVLLLCIIAVIHVFVFSAAFPFFNNVDEPSHFDLVVKYSHGHVPRGRETFSPDASAYLTLFSSCAFMGTPGAFPGHKMPPPLWTETPDQMRRDFQAASAAWQMQSNYEVSQAPLYYALAGFWWRAGQWIGLGTGHLLYWLRFLNIALVATAVWLAYAVTRIVFPDNNPFLRLAPSILLAFMPQTAFYSVGNDILSMVCFGLTFLCLLKWRSLSSSLPLETPDLLSAAAEQPNGRTPSESCLAAVAGLAFAATWLSKATNLPLLAVAGFAVLLETWHRFRRSGLRAVPPALSFAALSVPPIIAWAFWCKIHYGDFSGSELKMQKLGWTLKPFSLWWHHPLFSPQGIWTYLAGQLNTLWQGEFRWHNQLMALPGTTFIYTVISLALMAIALPRMFSKSVSTPYPVAAEEQPKGWTPNVTERDALRLSFICFMASLGFFALMSVIYDFHDCVNPSRDDPYFHAGRMLLGALIPFLLVMVFGLDRALGRFNSRTKFVLLGVLISAMLAAEIVTDWPAYSSPYNWFHLP